MSERKGENSRDPYSEEEISRRQFLRRLSYVMGISSAFLAGGGAGAAIEVTRADSEAIKSRLPFGVATSDESVNFYRTAAQIVGTGVSITGMMFAYISYLLHKEGSEPSPPPDRQNK